MSISQQRALIQATDPASGSVAARCQALSLSHSSFYYQPYGKSEYDLLGILTSRIGNH